MDEIGRTGLLNFAGLIQEDFLRELRGREAYKRYDEMRRNSPVIAALLMAYEQSIRRVDWSFVSEIENDPRIDLLNESRDAMSHSWNDHITEALTLLPFGYSIFEIIYQRVNGKVYWRKLAPRGQDSVYRWQFDDEGGLNGFTQLAAPIYKSTFIPIEKLILYRIRVEKNNPEGRSILRSSWIPYYYMKHIQQIEAIGIERDLAGLPMIKLPANASTTPGDSDLSKAQEIVRNVRNDEQAGVTLPPGWDFQLVSTGGSRQFDTDKIIKRYESRMLMSALSQFLMLGQEGVGSLALSSDQTDFFNMSVNSVADIIAETFTKYAIPRLLKLNGMDCDGVKLEHTHVGDSDVGMLVDALQKAGGLLTWDAQDEAWLRSLLDLPYKDIDILQSDRDKAESLRKEIAENIKSQIDTAGGGMMGAVNFASSPIDIAERRKFESMIKNKLTASMAKQKRKVLNAARGMRRG